MDHSEHTEMMTDPVIDHAGHSQPRAATHGQHGGHDKHEGHSPEMFRDRLWVSLALTVPILYFSEQFQTWFNYRAVDFAGVEWINPVLATFLFTYAGVVFLKGGRNEIRDRVPGMMTLISIAISVAYFYSLAVSLGVDGEPFYWELATLLDVMLLGHWIEMRSVQSASKALDDLAAMVPTVAHLVDTGGGITDVQVASLKVGHRILIRPGEQVPVDGSIVEGSSAMNEAFLTGESRPVTRGPGDEVVAGAVNGEGALTVEVTRLGADTALSQIMRLVEEAQASRGRFQVLADRAAFWLTVIAVGISVPTLVAWLAFGSEGTSFAVARSVTVLVIACPHALGLAIPLVNMNATSVSAKNGILVRNREAFERGRSIQFVALDKTGTLTEGRFVVSAITAVAMSDEEALDVAAALEQQSEHPLAAAIVEAAGGTNVRSSSVSAVPGHGLEGTVDDAPWRVGRPEWASELGLQVERIAQRALDAADQGGASAVVLMDSEQVRAVITLDDKVRDTARNAIRSLQALGIEPVMITGDAEAVAASVARELGIDRYHARVLPNQKADIVKELKATGPTAFVGDGINDAPALLTADLGIAIGAGTNVAIESADLVLVNDDPSDVARALKLARATRRKMLQNLGWATGYNVVALPLAAGVGVGAGILLSPAIGGLFMSASTVIVAINAMLLRGVDLD
ncbi:MAG: heavy metal translocating P-type ATPase [Acidimicrobiia bacterium]|nr:heavy metal translocating P-type ATPase [Acidimicrobiia bacterium]MDH5503622.1 heavy metal translocating P-type ATPase [Acidimicrobiia bacterium]